MNVKVITAIEILSKGTVNEMQAEIATYIANGWELVGQMALNAGNGVIYQTMQKVYTPA